MKYEEFRASVLEAVRECPKAWRKGQAVFNIVEDRYGVARAVQFEDGIDCFHCDSHIEHFLQAAWKRITKYRTEP